ncbi:MAG: hypothetical protein J5857_07355, partial [Treponema sp.]|nr:hypothetical protein [Treponema sp.]
PFHKNPETAKLIAEEEARLQKIKAEQEQKRINDSIFQQADSILQSAIEDYHRYLKQLPYDTIENRIALSLPDSLNGKNQKLSETLNWLLDTVKSKKAEIATRYTNDSIIFSKYNDKLHKLTETANARLLAYPYNLQQRTITDDLPINLFGKEEELEKALQTKHTEILGMVEQVEEEVYRETRKKYPQDFMEIYYSQHPEQKQRADSAYKECHCFFSTRLSFDMAFFDGTLPECDCREGAYQQLNNLFHSREEFDKAYNLPIDDFKKEIANRERMFLKIMELSNYLAARPQLNLKKATLYDDDAQIRKILKSIDIHRNSYFYAEAIDAVFKNNEMLEQEWEKNGAYFTSKSEIFEYWIGTGYNKELKKRKKEKQ